MKESGKFFDKMRKRANFSGKMSDITIEEPPFWERAEVNGFTERAMEGKK